jgi:alpha-ketoglutarate-dependent taurine dioxygenase
VREVDLPPDAPLDRYPRHDHPVYYPSNGGAHGPALFVTEHQTSHLVGVDLAESELMLQECFAALYGPDNQYVHAWKLHDVLIWNNLAVQHGRPTPVTGGPRDFWRLKTY